MAAFLLVALAVGWAATPKAVPLPQRVKEKLEATGNWSDVRFLQDEPKKDGGSYLAVAMYAQKFRCKVRVAGGAVTLQFYRPTALRPNGAEVAPPVASYEVGDDGQLRAAAGNSESLGGAAQELLDALRPLK